MAVERNIPLFLNYCPVCSVNCTCSKCRRKAGIVAADLKRACQVQRKKPSEVVFDDVLIKCLAAKMNKRKARPSPSLTYEDNFVSFEDELSRVKRARAKEDEDEESVYSDRYVSILRLVKILFLVCQCVISYSHLLSFLFSPAARRTRIFHQMERH